MATIAYDIGHHARVPASLISSIEKPRALQILNHLLTLCNPQKPEVWIDQGLLGKKLNLHRDTVGRWVRYLEKAGQLICLGFRPDGRRKRYQIVLSKADNSTPLNKVSGNKIVRRQMKKSDNVRSFHRTINKIEETNLKEQHDVHFFQKEFSSNEKIALKQKLTAIGLTQTQIKKLTFSISKSSLEILNNQINHLQYLLEQGQGIANQPGWLIKAVKENFKLPCAIDPTAIKQEQETLERREALRLAQDAAQKNLEGNHDAAKQLALKSLALYQNTEAQQELDKAKEALTKSNKLEELKKTLPITKISELLEQSFADVMKEFRKTKAEISQSAGLTSFVNQVLDQKILQLSPAATPHSR